MCVTICHTIIYLYFYIKLLLLSIKLFVMMLVILTTYIKINNKVTKITKGTKLMQLCGLYYESYYFVSQKSFCSIIKYL